MTGPERIYKFLSFLTEPERSADSDYAGVLVSAMPEWCASFRFAGMRIDLHELRSQPFMVPRICQYSGLESYYGVDFDEALDWFHSIGAIGMGERDSLRARRTLELMEDG